MTRAFRLGLGQVGPLQQSAVSCGAACLTVARMLRDPTVAAWVVEGPTGDRRTPDERFADLERRTMHRTNRMFSYPGHPQLPWPRALGTSPWGAARELEARGADPGQTYHVRTVRGLDREGLGRAFDEVVPRVRPGSPVLLYVGGDRLPRHICLVFAGTTDRTVLLYEPYRGSVDLPSRDAFVGARLGLAGWDRAWFLVTPGPQITTGGKERVRVLAPVPRTAPGAVMLREP